ncbi:MAG: two-component regulator propeller domain-containing protein, partial [Myxococcota bacterium]
MKKHVAWLIAVMVIAPAAGCSGREAATDAGYDGGTGRDAGVDAGADAGAPPQVYKDTPYPQEFHKNYFKADGLAFGDSSAAAFDQSQKLWVGGSGGIMGFDGTAWSASAVTDPVRSIVIGMGGVLWAAGPGSVYRLGASGWELFATVGGVSAIAVRGDGGLWLAETGGLGIVDAAGAYSRVVADPALDARAIIEASGTVYVATGHGVLSYDLALTAVRVYTQADGLPSNDVRSLALDPENLLWAGCAGGLANKGCGCGGTVFTPVTGTDGLPYDDVTGVHVIAAGDLLISTKDGAIRWQSGKRFRYYNGRYWLPSNDVREATASADGTLWFATAEGVGRVWTESYTLEKKAAHYQAIMRERHNRLGYFTGCYLDKPGDPSKWRNGDDDNDGQWTGMYLGALSFQYSVTKDPQVRQWAAESMQAMLKLESVAGGVGFFARTLVPGAECEAKQKSGGKWRLDDTGVWCWKGDTSSDEFVGHVYGLSLYYDLVADDAEKQQIAATIGRILSRLIDTGYILTDTDGHQSTDGHFDPLFMETVGLFGDAGLNGAMILGGLKFAYRITGEQKF